MTSRLQAGYAYREKLSKMHLAQGHHTNARGGYRDHTTTPVQTNHGKTYTVDRAIRPSTPLTPNGTKGPQNNPRDDTRRDPNQPDSVKNNETGTISNGKNIMIIGGVVLLAGVVYLYYR